MIKPYTIISTRQEVSGTGVDFSVTVRTMVDEPGFKDVKLSTSKSFIFVPEGEDIDNYLHNCLLNSGWIAQ
jgi:hypothetical protein